MLYFETDYEKRKVIVEYYINGLGYKEIQEKNEITKQEILKKQSYGFQVLRKTRYYLDDYL